MIKNYENFYLDCLKEISSIEINKSRKYRSQSDLFLYKFKTFDRKSIFVIVASMKNAKIEKKAGISKRNK